MWAEVRLCPWVRYDFHCTYFHKTHNCSVALDDGLYEISCKLVKKYGEDRCEFIYGQSKACQSANLAWLMLA